MEWLLKIVLVWLSIPGYLRASMLVVLVGVLCLAATRPRVRRSRLVRAGFALFLAGLVPLLVAGVFSDNPIGLGFLFALLAPIALLLIVSGTILALVTDRTSDTR